MKSPNEWRNRNVIKHTKCEPKHDEQRNKCRGKNSRMHNASFTSSSSFPFHSLLLLINFCDFFFLSFVVLFEWKVEVIHTNVDGVWRARVTVSKWTHICSNQMPNTQHAYSHGVCVKSNVKKQREQKTGKHKSVKRKQSSLGSFLWKIHFDDPIYLRLYNICIFADCIRQVLFGNVIIKLSNGGAQSDAKG